VSADNTYAYIKIGTTVYARAAHSAYGNGQAAVTLTNPTWSGTTGTSAASTNTATVSTSGRPTALSKSIPVTLSPGSWSDKKKFVDITTTNGTIVARTEVDASDIYTDGYNDAVPNMYAAGYSDTYSGTENKRYTIISGSGETALLGQSWWMTSTGVRSGNRKEIKLQGGSVTFAYRDGYKAGKAAGGGSVTPSVKSLANESKNVTPSYPNATLISGLSNIGSGRRVTLSVYGSKVNTKYWYFTT
jgi:hypothetical protein